MRLFESAGVDAVVLHPRFFEDRFRRRARHELLPWAASLTRLPLIASGDIRGAETAREKPEWFRSVCALMVGRMAVACPWVFAAWDRPFAVDYADVWRRLFDYTCADFPEGRALGRIKAFTEYYARNFRFGHTLQVAVQNAATLEELRQRADAFFDASPAVLPNPSLDGI
jgi:tRNA-dihydrouridine synthase